MQIMISLWIRPRGRFSQHRLAELADVVRRTRHGVSYEIQVRARWVRIHLLKDRRLRPGQRLTFERLQREVDAVVRRFKLGALMKRESVIVHVDFGVKYRTMTCSIGHADRSREQPSVCVSFYPCS